ncbi:MAG: hypothetical protein QME76_13030, partial [Bacillota bacterium]|nr:hypothetical protein [Bacillota bacterium]
MAAHGVWPVVVPMSWPSREVNLLIEVALIIGMYVMLAVLVLRSSRKILVYFLGLVMNGLLCFAAFLAFAITDTGGACINPMVLLWILSTLLSSIVYTIIVCAFLAVAN